MIGLSKKLDSSEFFAGGAGMFLQYHDVVKPVWFYAVIRMILMQEPYGLPIELLKNLSVGSLLEWYLNRRYKNPLKQLDWAHQIKPEELDKVMTHILEDNTIYKLAPVLNIGRMIDVYYQQHMSFPFVIYSENDEPYIKEDIKNIFRGIETVYVHGDLKKAISRCDQNFTFIFSDIELLNNAAEILNGTCSHLLIANNYRYNYKDNRKTFKYNLRELMTTHPFIRIGVTSVMNLSLLKDAFDNISIPKNAKLNINHEGGSVN